MIASCSKRQQASADKQARVVAFNSTEAIGAEAWWTVSSTRQGPHVESHGKRLHLWLRRYPRSPLALTLSRTRRSRLSSALHVMRARTHVHDQMVTVQTKGVHMPRCAAGYAQPDRCTLSNPCFLCLLSPRPLTCSCLSCSLAARVQPSVTQRRVCQCLTSVPFNERISYESTPRRATRARDVHHVERAAS